MKKILALILALAMIACLFAGCGDDTGDGDKKDVKVGVVLIGDENEGYTLAHINGIKEACKNLGLSETDNVVWKYAIPEDETCKTAIEDCIDQGCTLVFTNSYGHQDYAKTAAEQNPNVDIVAMTGDTAKKSNLSNFHNAFTKIYEARYVAGVVAGLKINQLKEEGKLTDKNMKDGKVKVGYVGAYAYAEVISGYTAFFLGIQSVCPDVTMDVLYTSSWFDPVAEGEAANTLMSRGCIIISQHADSTGAPSACQAAQEAGTTVYCVGYNIDMLPSAPTAALTSAQNDWSVYYTYAFNCALKGEDIATDWAKGYAEGANMISKLGESCAEGTAEKVAEVEKGIKEGTLNVFDCSKFTVGGETVTSFLAIDTNGDREGDEGEAITDGVFHESTLRSAPYFSLKIDGINELNNN